MFKSYLSLFTKILLIVAIVCIGAIVSPIYTPAQPPAIDVNIAIAANFQRPTEVLIGQFYDVYGEDTYNIIPHYGATGNFQREIEEAGAGNSPYDLLIAANAATPQYLKDNGYAPEIDQPTPYAIGQLVLYANDAAPFPVGPTGDIAIALLQAHAPVGKLVVADPENAPYGFASTEVLKTNSINAGNWYILQDNSLDDQHVEETSDIGQAFQTVETGGINFPFGFVAGSETCRPDGPPLPPQRIWTVDQGLYSQLIQSAIVLSSEHPDEATTGAELYLQFITEDTDARKTITDWCYTLPASSK